LFFVGKEKDLNIRCLFIRCLLIIKRRYTMGKVILKSAVKRKPGHLYYVDGKGNVCEAVMARGGRKKKKKKK